jgi:uncharacterized protein (TIGR02680 family)
MTAATATATAARCRPTRAGIVNLYQYTDQVFVFEDGRLALRGRNTSGKSKALEVLFPFALEGVMNPKRTDPFGKRDKTMLWNLVGHRRGGGPQTGIVWCEFSTPEGWVTCGIHLKGAPGDDRPRARFWLVRDARPGIDWSLLTDDRRPLTWEALKETLGERIETFGSAREYRKRINELVFGFPTVEQYDSYLDLMVQLRQPQLTRVLDVDQVMQTLSASLPTVDETLMRRLGEGLEQLREMQATRDRLVAARSTLSDFTAGPLREYARAEVRTRGERLRDAVSGYERVNELRRAAERDLQRAEQQAAELAARMQAIRTEIRSVEGAKDALESSAAWQQVGQLEQLRVAAAGAARAAEQATRAHADARRALDEAERRQREARASAEQAGRGFVDLATRLRSEAEAAGLAGAAVAVADELDDPHHAATVAATLTSAAQQRTLAIDRQRELIRAHDAAARDARQAEADAAQADADLAAARHELADRELAGERACDRLVAALDAWKAGLGMLALDADQVAAVEAAALGAGGEDERPLAEVLSALAAPVRAALADERAVAHAERDRVSSELDALRAERERVAAEPFPAPASRSPRRGERAGRAGAPLWALVDWREHVPAETRAGIEVALEEAGLLDAWVGAGGDVEQDTVLHGLDGGAAGSHTGTLQDVLVVAVGDSGVDASAVERVLAAVPLERAGEQVGVGDGWFRLGPAMGRYRKPTAEFIGAAARAALRDRRLAELDAALAELTTRHAAYEGAIETARQRQLRLDRELAEAPSTQELRGARRAVADATRAVTDAERRAGVLHQRADQKRSLERDAAGRASDHAAEHGLATNAAGLDAAVRRLRVVEPSLERLTLRAERVLELEQAAEQRFAELEPAREAASDRAADLRIARDEADRQHGAWQAAEASIGVEAAALRERAERLRTRRDELEIRRDRAHEHDKDLAAERSRLQSDVERLRAELASADARRGEQATRFRALGPAGLFAIALGDAAPDDHAAAEEWSARRAVEVARALPAASLATRAGLDTLSGGLARRVNELDHDLRDRDMAAFVETARGVMVVKVTNAGREQQIEQLIDTLGADVDHHERALSAEQARVFGDRLMDDIAEHLRDRIRTVQARVGAMNDTLAVCDTGSERRVSLKWTAADEDGADVPRLTKLLTSRAMAAMPDAERRQLRAFFLRCIDSAKEQQRIDVDKLQSTAAYLMSAFDYRRWYRFDLYEQQATFTPERLTRRRHGVGSGGEQAVLIHMPLFAAAASLASASRDERAPRLIVLDEALSGIDDDTRRKVLDVAVRLDLDWVMTSYDFNPCQPTVPRVSLYQLHRDNDTYGVHAEWFVWDGTQRIEVDGQAAWELSRT